MNTRSSILNLLKTERGFDFTGYRVSMLDRRLQKRVYATQCNNLDEYFLFLKDNPIEIESLVDVFTINVSRFFRNPLVFEYIRKLIFPELLQSKIVTSENRLRIWSAGCSFGEEPYTVAIILKELIKSEESNLKLDIFATDIDKNAITKAQQGLYNLNSLKNVKISLYQKYFKIENTQYVLSPEIINMVKFSNYDLLDKNRLAPPDSIYGGFDIILCRNVLIYFDLKSQKIIFNKLYKALNKNGYLVLGEAERPVDEFKSKFKQMVKCCKIYRKIG